MCNNTLNVKYIFQLNRVVITIVLETQLTVNLICDIISASVYDCISSLTVIDIQKNYITRRCI